MLATGLDSPLISIATTVHPSATASRMAVFTVCASWATLQVMDSLMVRCDACCTYVVLIRCHRATLCKLQKM